LPLRPAPAKAVSVVGNGAVGLLAILAAQQLGAERIIAISRHPDRQALAREFGATDIVEGRGDQGVAAVKELTGGLGAHSVIEAVGTQELMMQAIRSTRPGGHVGYVGVAHDVQLPGDELFFSGVHLHGGPSPVRRFLPELIQLIRDRKINPGSVFDLSIPLEDDECDRSHRSDGHQSHDPSGQCGPRGPKGQPDGDELDGDDNRLRPAGHEGDTNQVGEDNQQQNKAVTVRRNKGCQQSASRTLWAVP
jgi:NADPH:quinone reductase-like Zn-dependent oxidoreductase